MAKYVQYGVPSVRKLWLDALKGAAILLVVLSHIGIDSSLMQMLTACYMPIFFLASGYTFKLRDGALLRKWCQCIVPYFGWLLFYIAYAMFLSSAPSMDSFLEKLGGGLYSRFSLYPLSPDNKVRLFVHGAQPLWFFTCMVVSYSLAIPLMKAKGMKLLSYVSLYLVISCVLTCCPILLPWSLDTSFCGALFIVCGKYLFDLTSAIKGVLENRYVVPAVFLGGAFVYALLVDINGPNNMSVREYGLHGIGSVFLFLLIGIVGTIVYASFFSLIQRNKITVFVSYVLAYFGRNTLLIMCIHMFFIIVFKRNNLFILDLFGKLFAPKVLTFLFVITGCTLVERCIYVYRTSRFIVLNRRGRKLGDKSVNAGR